MLKKSLTAIVLLLLFFMEIPAQTVDYLKDESAPGSRAAMGVFASGYGKALAGELFGFERNTWQNRLSAIGLAATGYQLFSYDALDGVEFKPFKFNKRWKGYWEGYLTGEGLDLFLGFVRRYNGAKFIVSSALMISTGIVIAEGEGGDGWRKAEDGPLTVRNLFKNRHSYWVHFAGSGGLYWALSHHTATPEQALLYTTGLLWLWEVKDAYLPWEDYGFIGGDGFSWRDGLAGSIVLWAVMRLTGGFFHISKRRYLLNVVILS